ncbi:MAG: response regulator transcription factor [Chitinophaga sp.]|uniref:response regulator n=1 Tax=Chitinophaga sp. TaxID=1869181 RepID=UPI0025B7D57B|nr:response regulator transcription factor [Chitinophaga sp.]MBV8256159.1 response regulator transcription factor [Chitinophaga sp.]
MKSILILEDHVIVRMGISAIVKNLFGRVTIVESDNFNETIQILGNRSFDLLILDINIPGGNNLKMIDAVRLRQPEIRILVFSGYDEQLFGVNYIQAGANGYLHKDASEEEIRKALLMVMNRETYLSATLKDQLVQRISNRSRATPANPLHALSGREKEVLTLLVKGNNNMSIAKTLNLQVTTVSTYKNRIFEKLEISNIIELTEKVRLYSN